MSQAAPDVTCGPRTGHNRRRSERFPYIVEAWLSRDGETFEVETANLSKHGVGLTVDAELAAGTFYMFEIAIGPKKVETEIRVVACRAREDGRFEIGAEFC
jgi:hypothetical protein